MDKQSKDYQRAMASLQKLGLDIQSQTAIPVESDKAKKARLDKQLNNTWAGFESFCNWYFSLYIDAPFGWFHREAFLAYRKSKDYKGVWEWSRGHAKSVFLMMLALYDKARNTVEPNTFRGLVLASKNEDKADELLGAFQMELQFNQRYNADFGRQYSYGDWSDGNFSTQDGCGFWAFGLGQNPAGLRKGAKRPTHIFADDCDDKRRAENPVNVANDIDWIEGELMGTCDSKYGAKFVYVNNRVHCRGLTAYMVGDVEPGQKVRADIHHIKVFITEDPKTHKRLDVAAGGVPAWKERFTIEDVKATIKRMADNAERQLYHNHVEKGFTFKQEHIIWGKCLTFDKYDAIVSYADLSYKDTAKNDFKAVPLVGLIGDKYHIIGVWLRQDGIRAACTAHLQYAKKCPDFARHFYEANFIQDMHTDTYMDVAAEMGMDNIIREDKDRKDNKKARIGSLEPLFSYGNVIFNEKLRNDADMLRLIQQFLGFPNGHDDGPDAVHGAISKLREMRPNRTGLMLTGNYAKSNRG